MKKSQMVRKLLKQLKNLENCEIRSKDAREVLDFLTEEGMMPPYSMKEETEYSEGCKGYARVGYNWERER